MNRLEPRRKEALAINKRQKRFYENKFSKVRNSNAVMKAWECIRTPAYNIWAQIGIHDTILQRHSEWLGKLHGCRVLDLGCNTGNALTLKLAKESKSYLGIDLSMNAIRSLRETFLENGLKKAQARTVDFLDPNFTEKNFDVIYAHSVLHHFQNLDLILSTLSQKLAPGGRVITYDPMETSTIAWCVRKLYRPFQSNAAWEHPFSRNSIKMIERYFDITDIQGAIGLSKWVTPLAFLPFGKEKWIKLGEVLHKSDLKWANKQGPFLWQCLSVGMNLRRRETVIESRK